MTPRPGLPRSDASEPAPPDAEALEIGPAYETGASEPGPSETDLSEAGLPEAGPPEAGPSGVATAARRPPGPGPGVRVSAPDAWAYDAVARRLRARLAPGVPRPGHDAHLTMAPSYRLDRDLLSVEGKTARAAATLVLVYDHDGQAAVVLTVRPETLRDHGGQVAFPGGRLDPGESVLEAALREAREEVDLDPAAVEIVGPMTPLYVPPTRFAVSPVVALAPALPRLVPAPAEVAALLLAPLAALYDVANRHVAPWDTVFGASDVPHHRLPDATGAERRIWGATAMMLAELRALAAP